MAAMSTVIDDLAAKFLEARGESGESERRVIDRLVKRLHVSRDPLGAFQAGLTFGQRLADRIAVFGGSWTFILLFLATLVGWIVLNTLVLARVGRPFDAYPYIFLNLILSMLAALQAPVIMMSQNRHAAKDRVAAAHDYEVNLKAELEILRISLTECASIERSVGHGSRKLTAAYAQRRHARWAARARSLATAFAIDATYRAPYANPYVPAARRGSFLIVGHFAKFVEGRNSCPDRSHRRLCRGSSFSSFPSHVRPPGRTWS